MPKTIFKKKKKEDRDHFGSWNVPTSWEQVTLGQLSDIERLYDGDAAGNVSGVNLLSVLCGKSVDEVMALPLEFVDILMTHLVFLATEPQHEPAASITVDGETYTINVKEKLKFGEYVDFDSLMKSNKCDYPSMLAILARKPGEEYNSDFIANVFPSRVEMFRNLPVPRALPLISFFLQWSANLLQLSRSCSTAKDQLNREVGNIEDLLGRGGGPKWRLTLPRRKLRKLKKLIAST